MVGSVPVLAKVQAYAREQCLLVQEMHIRGKVHSPENVDLAEELCNLCDRNPESLQLPDARSLQAPVRSNKNGESIRKGSLTHEVVNTILASRCEWYTLLTELAKDLDLTGRRSHLFATFGIGDCVHYHHSTNFSCRSQSLMYSHLEVSMFLQPRSQA